MNTTLNSSTVSVVLLLSLCVILVMATSDTNRTIDFNIPEASNTALWVSTVIGFSSEYGGSWSAQQVIGSPKVYPRYGDIGGSWAPRSIGRLEYLELGFEQEIHIQNITVYETFHAGAVTRIGAWNAQAKAYQFVYRGTAQDIRRSRIFEPKIDTLPFKSKRIRLDLDCTVANSWCEIDAVKIVGMKYPQFTVSATPLPEDMKELLDQTTFSDVYFVVEGRRVFAHKAILAARSVYFNTLLSNTSLNFCSVEEEISVTGIKYSTFTSILEFIYTGKVNCSLNASTIVELYLMTYKHDMRGLQQCLKDCLSKDNSVDTILKLLIAANGINELAELQQLWLGFLANHHVETVSSAVFPTMPKNKILEFVHLSAANLTMCS